MNGIVKFCLCMFTGCLLTVVHGAVYDVTEYYQAGDTSYAEAVGRAITAADGDGGGVIYFPPGTYQIHQTIYAKKNLTFEGSSGPGGSSVIQATGSSAFNLFCCFNVDASNVVFKNLVIDLNNLSNGGDTAGIGIYVHSDTNFNGADSVTGTRIENCEIKNGSSHGIRGYHTSTDGSIPFSIRIKNCRIYNCALRGIRLRSVTEAIVSGTEIYGCDNGGIFVYFGSNQIIKSCNIHDNDNDTACHGIEMKCAENWKVVNNTVTGNKGVGIAAVARTSTDPNIKNFIVSGNVLESNESGNIKVDPSVDTSTLYDVHGIVADNICSGYTGTNGIEVKLATNVVISGNICKNHANGSGIYVFGKYCVLSNNISSGNGYGIYLHTTSSFSQNPLGYHEINQNRLYSNTANDIYLESGLMNVNSTQTEDLTN